MASSSSSNIFQWDFTLLNHASFHSYSRGLFLLLIFFTILFFVIILSLYARWLCSHRLRRRVSAAAAGVSSSGLDRDSIDSLPIIILQTNSNGKGNKNKCNYIEESECSICLGVFEEIEKLKVLPECNHAYHSECVDKWLSSQSSCPLCRASLSPVIAPSNHA
ncbi:Zinc finger, RING-type [Corchorus olitorius]|uniref:Zinc finger, RING-type n=1 Tax=Corchorus olitorius TaxID=93759 RepID=A0A1R3K5Q7_9ROSI|nr:Zinc finger, RING-type [Corchorus olitorius]